MTFTEVQQKQLVCLSTGEFLGYIEDAIINEEDGYIESFILQKNAFFTSLFKSKDDKESISFSQIESIGEDVILVRKH